MRERECFDMEVSMATNSKTIKIEESVFANDTAAESIPQETH